jgi:myo-inositol 2-dehydrogenase/D-chiro-inositol 1-dehydrogenase
MGMRGKPVHLGIVGCGRITATRHLPALLKLPEVRIVGIADVDTERLQQTAKTFHISHQFANIHELLKNVEIDAVAVCVPVQFHAEVALAALKAAKHVFMEKPLAATIGECRQIIQAAENAKTITMIGFNLRWHRLVNEARNMLDQGKLGNVKLISSVSTSGSRNSSSVAEWRRKRDTGGGVLIEQAIHHFDLWRFLLQDEITEIFATSLNDDETATVTARTSRGILISASFSEVTAHENELLLYGDSGRLRISNYRFDGLEILPAHGHPGDLKLRLKKCLTFMKESPQILKMFLRGGDFIESYSAEWRHFLDCVQRNVSATPKLEEGYRAQLILEAALKSTSQQSPIRVEPPAAMNDHEK